MPRSYYRETKQLFDRVDSLAIPGVEMEVLSMGMSNAYRVAIEEGSTMIRPGTNPVRGNGHHDDKWHTAECRDTHEMSWSNQR